MSVDFSTRESIMTEWDKWRKYIAEGGKGSWPGDAFESLLDYFEERDQKLQWMIEEIEGGRL